MMHLKKKTKKKEKKICTYFTNFSPTLKTNSLEAGVLVSWDKLVESCEIVDVENSLFFASFAHLRKK